VTARDSREVENRDAPSGGDDDRTLDEALQDQAFLGALITDGIIEPP
jgi:hypothetical protein